MYITMLLQQLKYKHILIKVTVLQNGQINTPFTN